MPRQIHVTITAEQKALAEQIAGQITPPIPWQEVARKALQIGLQLLAAPIHRVRADGTYLRDGISPQGDKKGAKPWIK